MEEENAIIPVVLWTKKNYATEYPIPVQIPLEELQTQQEQVQIWIIMMPKIVQLTRDIPVFAEEGQDYENAEKYPIELENNQSDLEDYKILPTDCILIAGKIEQEFASLEIYIFEEKTANFFVHHDLILSSFPVCLEWLELDFNTLQQDNVQKGNLAIVGLMTSEIEFWDLNLKDPVEPQLQLKGDQAHTQAITSLNLHYAHKNLLLSGSQDQTVKVWDLEKNIPIVTKQNLKSGVRNSFWLNQKESLAIVLTENNQLRIFDVRTNEKEQIAKLNTSIENICQNPSNSEIIYCGGSKGELKVFDLKTNSFIDQLQIQAHENEISDLVCTQNGVLVTNSLDGLVKAFDIQTMQMINQATPNTGQLFGNSIHPENPFLFACGSSKGEVVLWDYSPEQLIINGNF